MEFSLTKSLEVLERTPTILSAMLGSLHADWTTTNEGGNSWNAAEVVAHLIICERTNWMVRTKIILSGNNDRILEAMDMASQSELAKTVSLSILLEDFRKARENNMRKLRLLHPAGAELKKTALHPKLGTVTLGNLLATWTAHDLSHIAQLCRIMAKQYKDDVGPFAVQLSFLNN